MTHDDFNTGRREYIPRKDWDYKWPSRFMPYTYDDAILGGATEYDRQMQNYSDAPMDVLNADDTISLEELEENEPASDFTTAGFSEVTEVDTFINMNGDTRYVTSI